ncbi:HAMP domain-containing sensor histidine kinase [Bdellovibrionota bacterium FG-1]
MQRFSQLIFKQINATLATAGAMIAVGLWVYAVAQVSLSKKHAESFLMTQAIGVSRGAATENNALAIQAGLERFINDWNKTEPLEARTEIQLDGVLVAKAGQAQPFTRFFSSMRSQVELPSGSVIQIQTDLAQGKYWLQVLAEIALLESLILVLFLFLKRRIGKVVAELSEPLEEAARWIQSIARDLPDSAKNVDGFKASRISEVESVRASVVTLAREIVELEEKLTRTSFDRGRLQMADQVVHDIRSPLSTLDMWVAAAKSVTPEDKEGVRGPIRRIQDIINTLLSQRSMDTPLPIQPPVNAAMLLLPLIEQVVSEKRLQYSKRAELKIEGPEPQDCYAICSEVEATEFQRMLSNLIDNAVESISGDGWVIIKLAQNIEHVTLEVSDTGKGMTEEQIARVLNFAESIDKPGGSGMGLKHAQAMAHAWKGKLSVQASPGLGCSVRVEIPQANLPAGLLRNLDLSGVSAVAVVDDDPTVHALWDFRWAALELSEAVTLTHVFKPSNLIDGSDLYLVDYDLGPGVMSGIELIKAHGLAERAVLVTSRYADPQVTQECEELGIRRIPKGWAAFIPIHTHSNFRKSSGAPISQGEDVFALLT